MRCHTCNNFAASLLSTLLFGFVLLFPATAIPDSQQDWQGFERAIRDGKIGRNEAYQAMVTWEDKLTKTYPEKGFGKHLFFPLKVYSLRDCGGRQGEGYSPKGYDFLDGNSHKGHPAQDIFIQDRNQDCLDDRSLKPDQVLSIADGVVMSVHGGWTSEGVGRDIRGGNYIWIYHPGLRFLSYYAHLKDVRVCVGERVSGGGKIATLGRTGKNACLNRSPTHLHVMVLAFDGMKPVDLYRLLAPVHPKARKSPPHPPLFPCHPSSSS